MQMTVRLQHLLLAALLTAVLASCDRQEPTATAPTPAPAKPTPPPILPAAVPSAEDHSRDGGAATEATTIVATGDWSENKQYKFRLARVASCGDPAATLGPAQPTAASTGGAFKRDTTWVGALLSLQSKEKSLFVSPRDLELRRGGVILTARHINQPLLAGCTPLLPAKQLRVGDDVSGFALFEVPKSFRTTTEDPIVLSYKPTRWGGARRVEVPIRECLDACPETSASKAGKAARRSTPVSRPKL